MPLTRSPASPQPDLDALASLSRAIAESTDLAATFHSVMELCADAFGMTRGALTISGAGGLTLRLTHGFEDETLERVYEYLAAPVLADATPRMIPDLLDEPAFLERLGVPDTTAAGRALFCLPVRPDSETAGVLCVDKPEARPATLARDLAALRAVAAMLGQAIRVQGTLAELEDVKSEAESILTSMPNGVIAIDNYGHVVSLNPAAERMFGVRARAALGRPYRDVFSGHRAFTRLVDGVIGADPGQTSTDLTLFSPEGESIPASLVWSRLRDRTNDARGIIVTIHDRTELRRLERQVRRAQRLAALGTMAAGVAHEIRNPLAAIRGAAQLAKKRVGTDERLRTYVELTLTEVERLDGIVEQLVRFARPQKVERRPMQLRDVVAHALSLVEAPAAQAQVTTRLVADETIPALLGDPHQLTQVFLNLFLNAIQAMRPGGQLTVRLQTDSAGRPGERVALIIVQDTGSGMDRQTLEKLFTPFFTTKPEGTGLGLAIAHRIMEEHGGGLDVVSAPDEGSTFFVSLPLGGCE